jgi:hypothetical protein
VGHAACRPTDPPEQEQRIRSANSLSAIFQPTSMQQITLGEMDARRLFRRCVWTSFVPVAGLVAIIGMATYESSLPPQTIKPIAAAGLAGIFGGELYFCHLIGRLAQGLGQSGARWRNGVWIASKFFAFLAWWLALIKIRFIMSRTYAPQPTPIFPQ